MSRKLRRFEYHTFFSTWLPQRINASRFVYCLSILCHIQNLSLYDIMKSITKNKKKMRRSCEQAPCEGTKIFGERSVNPAAKGVWVGAWIRERSHIYDVLTIELEKEARSSGLHFFKTESVEVLQYSLNSALTALRSGSVNSSRTFRCWKNELASVFQFVNDHWFVLIVKGTVICNTTTWSNYYNFQLAGLFSEQIIHVYRRSHLWSRTSTFEVSSFSPVDVNSFEKFNVFLTPVFLLWPFLGWGLRCGEEIEVGRRRLNLLGVFSPEESLRSWIATRPCFY